MQKQTQANSHQLFWGPGPMRFWSGSALPANAGSDKIPGKGERDTLIRVETLAPRCSLAILICSHGNAMRGLPCWTHAGWEESDIMLYLYQFTIQCWAATRHDMNIMMSLFWSNGNQSWNQLCCASPGKTKKKHLIYSCHMVVLFFVVVLFSPQDLFAHYFVKISLFSM